MVCWYWLHGNEVRRRASALPTRGLHQQGTCCRQPQIHNACVQGVNPDMVRAQGLLLKDKGALVTGASHGIGRTHACRVGAR